MPCNIEENRKKMIAPTHPSTIHQGKNIRVKKRSIALVIFEHHFFKPTVKINIKILKWTLGYTTQTSRSVLKLPRYPKVEKFIL